MNGFNPTHTFRGLELEFQADEECVYGLAPFRDYGGLGYFLPVSKVTKIQPKPKPGEVWRYDDPDEEVGSFLVVIASDGEGFRTEEDPYETMYSGDLEHMTKVLNADGTPA